MNQADFGRHLRVLDDAPEADITMEWVRLPAVSALVAHTVTQLLRSDGFRVEMERGPDGHPSYDLTIYGKAAR